MWPIKCNNWTRGQSYGPKLPVKLWAQLQVRANKPNKQTNKQSHQFQSWVRARGKREVWELHLLKSGDDTLHVHKLAVVGIVRELHRNPSDVISRHCCFHSRNKISFLLRRKTKWKSNFGCELMVSLSIVPDSYKLWWWHFAFYSINSSERGLQIQM